MGDTARRIFTRSAPSKRRPDVARTRLPAPPVEALAPPVMRVGIGSATRERCACGRLADTGDGVWLELVGGHLRAMCPGCGVRP